MGCKHICDNPTNTLITETSKPITINKEIISKLDIDKYISLLSDPDAYKFLLDNKNFNKLVSKLTEDLDLNTIYIIMYKINEKIMDYQIKCNNLVLVSHELLQTYKVGVVKPLSDINKYIPIPAKAESIKQCIVKNISNLAELYHFFEYENSLFSTNKTINYSINKWVDVPDVKEFMFKIYFNFLDNVMQIKVNNFFNLEIFRKGLYWRHYKLKRKEKFNYQLYKFASSFINNYIYHLFKISSLNISIAKLSTCLQTNPSCSSRISFSTSSTILSYKTKILGK
jgi:hypothetical protein